MSLVPSFEVFIFYFYFQFEVKKPLQQVHYAGSFKEAVV